VELKFYGTNAQLLYTKGLLGNDDIRDYYENFYTNNINDTNTINVFKYGSGYQDEVRLDKQWIDLPEIFDTETLTKIELIDLGAPGPGQQPFLAGVTIEDLSDTVDPCMIPISGGEFLMGDHFDVGDTNNEKPIHSVYVDSFYMGIKEVTNRQYCNYLNSAKSQGLIEVRGDGKVYAIGGSHPYCDTISSFSQISYDGIKFSILPGRKNHPLLEVSWHGAAAYCNWLSNYHERQVCYDLSTWECDFSTSGYRLPTEAEWEYAARGGLEYYKYPWGNDINDSRANYNRNFCGDVTKPCTISVGCYSTNGYGLYDMAGNVWELCNDWYDSSYYDVSPYENPHGPANGIDRVIRGGGFGSTDLSCRVANREWYDPNNPTSDVGFRVVKPIIIFHVDCVNGDNGNDGLSRETAFATIQFAIDKASDDDTILVWPGVYNEAATYGINFKGKAITVKSAADAAVLEVPGFVAATFIQGEDGNSVLSNFVLRGSTSGIFALFADPTINNVTVVGNNNGIIADNANPNISNSIFWNNINGDLFGSPDPITAQYSFVQDEVEANLVAYWKLDGDATDSAGSNHGTIYGATPVTGQVGGALSFDGDDYVQVADDDSLDISDEITISAWINPSNTSSIRMIVSKYKDYAGMSYLLELSNEKLHFMLRDVNSFFGIQTFSIGIWYHVVATYDGSRVRGYINGELDNEQAAYGAIPITTQELNIGRQADNNLWPFEGLIDEVRIYNRALSTEVIEGLYNTGLAGQEYGPLFADANNGDYHLLSERGRYRATTDEWILDAVTSPCVDGGDPSVKPVNERMPNGGRINMGAYGNTAYASMSEWPLKHDSNFDGIVNMLDLARLVQEWLEKEEWKE
jgi:formylglycine-generating enzyme required for sulfatase activity